MCISGCPLVQATVTSLCNGTSVTNAEFNPPALQYQRGKYLVVVYNDVSEVTVSKAGLDNTTLALPDTLPDTLEVGMNCSGKICL